MSTEHKRMLIAETRARLASAEMVAVIDHFGIDGPTMSALRMEARASGWQLQVTKNTLARNALANTDQAGLSQWLGGPTMLMFAPVEGRAALRWLCRSLPRQLPKALSSEWTQMQANPVSYRERWRAQQAKKSGGWARLPRPGARLCLRGAWLQGDLLNPEAAMIEADLNPAEIYGRLLAVLQAPSRRLLQLLQAHPTTLTRLLEARHDQLKG
ncbi:MAG: 50S ribosomal protein L10 [Myxococcota bacterium]